MSKFLSVFCFVALTVYIKATDYCNKNICNGNGATHIACNNNGKLNSACPNDAEMREMTQFLQKIIVDAHNEKRNKIAGGDSLKPACRMATMKWDNELASLAALNCKQCQMKHDNCHNTDDFKYSGQNLASLGYRGAVNDSARISQSIELWYAEKKDVFQSIIDKYPNGYKGPTIGHFTVMMVDRNIRVGCAASTYSVAGKDYDIYLFACNYASNNIIGFPIYKSCNKPATDCNSGINLSYKNLCSSAESYKVNQFP